MAAVPKAIVQPVAERKADSSKSDSSAVLRQLAASEMFFAVVGPVGAGSSHAARQLARSIITTKLDGKEFTCEVLKAGNAITEWIASEGKSIPDDSNAIDRKIAMQGFGDEMRKKRVDNAAVAVDLIQKIAEARARAQKKPFQLGQPVEPDGKPRAYILNSLKHPAEAQLLRRLYGNAFVLIGVVCSKPVRRQRLISNFFNQREGRRPANQEKVDEFIRRDADDEEHKYGQHVTDTFHEADFFVDNTPNVVPPDGQDLRDAVDPRLIGEFNRLISIVVHKEIRRPTPDETAMHVAYSAKLRSSCLSRQVGAALLDRHGNIVASGTNEVPKAGGGVYGEERAKVSVENRCAFCDNNGKGSFCSNNTHQNDLINEAIDALYAKEHMNETQKDEKLRILRKTQIGGLLEFSRSVHAEMDALLSAARSGVSTVGSRLFVTTFPCHFCARHIVTAGVYEVQYIEPYPKSWALNMHGDAIETVPEKWIPPREESLFEQIQSEATEDEDAATIKEISVGISPEGIGKVLFKPFVGVAPKLYQRVFLKDREYKDKVTGKYKMGDAEWGSPWSQHQVSYAQLEAKLLPTI